MATDLQLAAQDSATDSRFAPAVSFGIFLDGAQVLLGDSFTGYDYSNESRITQVPLQAGAFASLNKVATPYSVRVRITKGGSAGDRATLLAELDEAAASLNLYDIVTPEKTYRSANIVKVSHAHSAERGAAMLELDIHFLEVRQIASASFTVVDQSPSSSPSTMIPIKPITTAPPGPRNDPTHVGVVQTQQVLPQVEQQAAEALLLLQGP